MTSRTAQQVQHLEALLDRAENPDHGPDYEAPEALDHMTLAYEEDQPLPQGVPVPTFWRVLVMPIRPKTMSRGGIALPTMALQAEEHLQLIGRVVAFGPCAYKGLKHCANLLDVGRLLFGRRVGWAPKAGDWVVYGRFAGQRMEYKGTRLIELNDDEVLGLAEGPEGFRVHV